jgi:site-specific DNA recombinase
LQNPVYCIADADAYHYFGSLDCVMACDTRDFNGTYGILSYNRTRHRTGKKQIKRPPGEWVIATGKHQGIIEGKTFVKVQKMIKENKSKGSPRSDTSGIALVSGKITCSGCGARLRVKNIRKSAVHTTFCYACEMKILSKGSRCSIPNIPGNVLDAAILEILGDLLGNVSQNYIPYLKQKKVMLFDTADESKKKLELLTAEANLLNNSIKTLLSQLTGNESPLTVKYILPRLEKLDKSLELIQNEIKDLKADKEDFIETDPEVSSLYYDLTDIRTLINTSGLLSQKLLLDSLIEQIEWDGESVYITLKTAAPENFSRDRGSRFYG